MAGLIPPPAGRGAARACQLTRHTSRVWPLTGWSLSPLLDLLSSFLSFLPPPACPEPPQGGTTNALCLVGRGAARPYPPLTSHFSLLSSILSPPFRFVGRGAARPYPPLSALCPPPSFGSSDAAQRVPTGLSRLTSNFYLLFSLLPFGLSDARSASLPSALFRFAGRGCFFAIGRISGLSGRAFFGFSLAGRLISLRQGACFSTCSRHENARSPCRLRHCVGDALFGQGHCPFP
jgi:hypothetical protein